MRAPNRRSPRLRDFDYSDPNHVLFITVVARKRGLPDLAPFSNAELALKAIQTLHQLRDAKGLRLLGYCLMPDHLHVLLSVSERSGSLIDVVRDFKSYSTRIAWQCGWKGRLWARSFHDRVVRTEGELLEVCHYMLDNPVKAGLTEAAEDYPYSHVDESLLP